MTDTSAPMPSSSSAAAEDEEGSPETERLVAVVTGGASGIGAAAATALAERGAFVAALDLNPQQTPPNVAGFACDVSDDASVRRAMQAVVTRFGRLDILVNNAGIGAQGDVSANTDEEWQRVLDIDVVGMARTTRAALPHLRASPSAAVVNTCSIAAWAGLPNRALYSAAKGGVYGLTLAMAADHVADGVRVNAVAPGTVDTPWVGHLLDSAPDPAAERAALEQRQPSGRLVTAQEVGEAIAYLATPASSATTGTVLAVDGGMHGLRVRPAGQPS